MEYLGWISGLDKEQALNDSSIFVLPSYYEGMPVTVLEAMAHGCLVVATKVGGVPTMIEDNETGLLISPKSEEELLNALIKALSDEDYRRKLGAAGYREALLHYDINKSVDRLIQIYASTF